MRKVFTLLLCLAVMATLAACTGGSEADKAYDSWVKDSASKMQQATADYQAKAGEVAGDAQAAYDMTSEYYAVVLSVTRALEAIDTSQLSSERKTQAQQELVGLQTQLQELEGQLETVEQMLQ